MTALEVLATGPLVLVEDAGRPGLAAVGVGRSGAADRTAHRLGARLVGHPEDRASLEVLLGGLRVRARGRLTVAVTGAPAPATLDGRPVAHATLVEVPDGGVLALGMPAGGLRTYLTVRGGVDVPAVLGSRSTDTLSGLGPPAVTVGDVLPVGAPGSRFPTVDHAPHPPARHDGPVVLEVLPGPRASWVGGWETGLGGLLDVARTVAGETDRVGLRLTGPAVERVPDRRASSCPPRAWCAGPCRCPRAASRSSSSPTTP